MKYLIENSQCDVIAVFNSEEERKAWTEEHCTMCDGAWFLGNQVFWAEAYGNERYKVTYEFENELCAWKEAELTNNGKGFDLLFAREWKSELISAGCKNVTITEM